MRVLLAMLSLTLPLHALAQAWSVEGYVGDAYNLRTRLKIEQDGGFSRSLDADYDTRGFESPLYYMLRVARWREQRAWEVALTHHKIYLGNPPGGVADVSISHGFNILSLTRAARSGPWVYRLGAGPVITHAEATINGVRYDGPYRLSGAALVAGGGWRLELGKAAFLSAELMGSAAYVKAKMDGPPDATLTTSNMALHVLAGLGYEFR